MGTKSLRKSESFQGFVGEDFVSLVMGKNPSKNTAEDSPNRRFARFWVNLGPTFSNPGSLENPEAAGLNLPEMGEPEMIESFT